MSNGPKRNGELSGRTGDDDWLIYEPEVDEVHVLNPTAKAIWDLCDGFTSLDEMAGAVAEVTGIDLKQAKADVASTIARLAEIGLVSL